MAKTVKSINLDDERANRTFSFFLICLIVSFFIGLAIGVAIAIGITL